MNSRIKDLMQKKGLTQKEVADALGITKQAVSYWCQSNFVPRADKAEKLAELLGVSPAALMFGEDDPHSALTEDENTVLIPCLDVKASCGLGDLVLDAICMVKLLKVSRDWIRARAPFANIHKLNVITADGDSMAPDINNGDLLLVDRSKTEITGDAVYVIRIEQNLYVKRVQRIPGGLRIISDNSDKYRPFDVTGEALKELAVIGRVCTIANMKSL